MAGDEVGAVDQVGRPDRLRPEPQVRHRDRARLLRVVDEVALGVEVGALADDLHRALVRAHRAVGAEPEEHRLHLARRAGVHELRVDRKAQAGDVVVDPDGEVSPWAIGRELVEDRLEHRRRDLLGGQAVPAADDPRRPLERRRVGVHRLVDGGEHRQVERLADRARLLRAVEHRDGAHRRRQRGDQRLARERLEQPHRHHADPLTGCVQVVDRLLDRARRRTHDHDHAIGVDRTVVLDEPVAPTGPRRELVEHLLDDARHREVERVGGLPGLEEDIGVLRRAPYDRRLRRHAAGPEGDDVVLADQRGDVLVGQRCDLVDLVRGAEPVEEVEERHPRPQRRRRATRARSPAPPAPTPPTTSPTPSPVRASRRCGRRRSTARASRSCGPRRGSPPASARRRS